MRLQCEVAFLMGENIAMAYTPLTFVAGEILTATKMNKLAANDAAFNDGTGLANNVIQASKINRSTFERHESTAIAGFDMGNYYTTVQTWTVTNPGVYFIKYSAWAKNNGSGNGHTVICDIWKGSVGTDNLGGQREQISDNGEIIQRGQTVTVTAMATLAAGDTVYVTAAAYDNIIWFEEGKGFIQQVI